jgi:hypothetical protein
LAALQLYGRREIIDAIRDSITDTGHAACFGRPQG